MLASSSLLLSTAALASAASMPLEHQWARRGYVSPEQAADNSYDYIVIGGGNAGLVVASRLSEDQDVSVLVIEAGGEPPEEIQREIDIPAQAYLDGVGGSDYDWNYETVAQSGLDGRTIGWPRGRVLGGSTAVNGLYMTRASEIEYNAWDSLQNDSLYSWDWDTVFPYLKKAEDFHVPEGERAEVTEAVYDLDVHGQDGPIHQSQGGYVLPQENFWMDTWANLDYEAHETHGGETWGPRIALSCINPTNWTRSYAKSGYLDPYIYRTNLNVLTGQYVSRIAFEGNDNDTVRAVGVEFQATADAEPSYVGADREVIVSAGVIGSPQLLEVSGVGQTALLQSLGIDVVVDLPGVGEHLSDHCSTGVTFQLDPAQVPVSGDSILSNATFQAEQMDLWENGQGQQSLYSTPNEPLTYVSLTQLVGEEEAQNVLEIMRNNASTAAAGLTWADETVQAGFRAVYDLYTEELLPSDLGATEYLQANLGWGGGESGITFTMQGAIQRPTSQGYTHIKSADVFEAPEINPNYLYNDVDMRIMVATFQYLGEVASTAPLSDIILQQLDPQESPDSPEAWTEFIRGRASTEYHPAMSCSMLPLELGGVVDTALMVYGTSNLRVIDSSVIPMAISAHLQEPTYGIGEYGAAIIKGEASRKDQSSSDSEDEDEDEATNSNSDSVDSQNSNTDESSASIVSLSASIALVVASAAVSLAW